MRVILELLRIILIFAILGGLLGELVHHLYATDAIHTDFEWLGGVAILVLLFVLYRNKLQISGWYKGKGTEKLSPGITRTLIGCSIFLFVSPFIIGWIQV
ncbi:hypothetical protein [Salinibacillus xinjiangensis]|uniref:Uncharacterized protein n=1 Tax=Salinibacillus xinjiangensis TaxID=1229268 RepID=A0A6G1XBK0_9BACI|nr:hypothetical protein [Salinibacillus xinjiangensis]MRG88317.1 hypothetical protein [Salinibacillus xinjiangensis]